MKMEVSCRKCGTLNDVSRSFCPVCGEALVVEYEDFVHHNITDPKAVWIKIAKNAAPFVAILLLVLLVWGLFVKPNFYTFPETISAASSGKCTDFYLSLMNSDSNLKREFLLNEVEVNLFCRNYLPKTSEGEPQFSVTLSYGTAWLFLQEPFGKFLPGYFRLKVATSGEKELFPLAGRMGVIPAWGMNGSLVKTFSEKLETIPVLSRLLIWIERLEVTDAGDLKVKLRNAHD